MNLPNIKNKITVIKLSHSLLVLLPALKQNDLATRKSKYNMYSDTVACN
jgi:hypothetical protein